MDFLRRKYTLGEELFNAITHGIGALLSVAGCVVLLVRCHQLGDSVAAVSSAIYGTTLIILYTMSTLYHALANEKAKAVFRVFDHVTIYLLIAGTYTPYTLACLGGALGWTLFGIVWAAAIVGIVFSSISLRRFQKLSMICYIAMGWVILIAIKPLWQVIGTLPMVFLVIGGVLYTGGVLFYQMKESRYMHSIWHLFVIAGSIFQYFSILLALT
ncbi:PAQR family membrane homeostasis protein TrhA [Ruminococcus champanellensis]|uniref:Channel protein, hemolysin III family n=1 Tax=Ruminococcus champanellensis (strain DSM 18848 / JCM 17042 / KCTC 15320 / 18P13) TaxID=213810 RepID=D4LD52_RUMC1|nr:hemolysin III family protein [Ruminococcus champanellensis]CBL17547.1 channel protein, hemolysin III family [Ruminococcus champanellensis 18P13 = JCM 17042]